MWIGSFLPAATEICFALDLGNDVVGVSPEILAHILHPEAFPKSWSSTELQSWTG